MATRNVVTERGIRRPPPDQSSMGPIAGLITVACTKAQHAVFAFRLV